MQYAEQWRGEQAVPLAPPDLLPDSYDRYGELVRAVQTARLFPDGMDFVKMQAQSPDSIIADEFKQLMSLPEHQRVQAVPSAILAEFVSRHFLPCERLRSKYIPQERTLEGHGKHMLWVLKCSVTEDSGPEIGVDNPFITPDDVRFVRQFFYWDQESTITGLLRADKYRDALGTLDNLAQLARRFDGLIPNSNNINMATRGQPMLFANMVYQVADAFEARGGFPGSEHPLIKFLPEMLLEYNFVRRGEKYVTPDRPFYEHAARMPDGSVLAKFHDFRVSPRWESCREDDETVKRGVSAGLDPRELQYHMRVVAASGLDISSQFANGPEDYQIHAGDIAPAYLNAILVRQGNIIATALRLRAETMPQSPEQRAEDLYRADEILAESRKRADTINRYLWSEERGMYVDFDAKKGRQKEFESAVNAAFILCAGVADSDAQHVGIATPEHIAKIMNRLDQDFLKQGGVINSLEEHPERQWDYFAWGMIIQKLIEGARRCGYGEWADGLEDRWAGLTSCEYENSGHIYEKYDAVRMKRAKAGEYDVDGDFAMSIGAALEAHAGVRARVEQKLMENGSYHKIGSFIVPHSV